MSIQQERVEPWAPRLSVSGTGVLEHFSVQKRPTVYRVQHEPGPDRRGGGGYNSPGVR